VHRPTPQPSADISVSREPAAGDGPELIVARAVAELIARYATLSPYELELDSSTFDPPRGAFLVARAPGVDGPIGGVGVRGVRLEKEDGDGGWDGADGQRISTAEVRRLWVDPAWRGRGVARALMESLEYEAIVLGYRSLELETGVRQPEAVALYEATGWERHRVDRDGSPLPTFLIRFTKLIAGSS
jgi:GNAT superfamily N-acetyltransferase